VKKIILIGTISLMLVTVVGIAIASNGNGRATTRVMADTTGL